MNDNTSSLIFTAVTSSAACAYLLQLLQKWSKTPWITEHTTGINMAVRAALSFAATLGISVVWNAGTNNGHTLTIAIPSGIVLAHGVWHWFGQYALQHFSGKILSIPEPDKPGALLTEPPKA